MTSLVLVPFGPSSIEVEDSLTPQQVAAAGLYGAAGHNARVGAVPGSTVPHISEIEPDADPEPVGLYASVPPSPSLPCPPSWGPPLVRPPGSIRLDAGLQGGSGVAAVMVPTWMRPAHNIHTTALASPLGCLAAAAASTSPHSPPPSLGSDADPAAAFLSGTSPSGCSSKRVSMCVAGSLLFRGPRVRVGVDHGPVIYTVQTYTGCIGYQGRMAARAMKISMHAAVGQVVCTQTVAAAVEAQMTAAAGAGTGDVVSEFGFRMDAIANRKMLANSSTGMLYECQLQN